MYYGIYISIFFKYIYNYNGNIDLISLLKFLLIFLY